MATNFSVFTYFCAFAILLFGIFVFIKNHKRPTGQSFFLISLSSFLWQFFASVAYNTTDQVAGELFMRLSYIGVNFIAITVFHFTIEFLEKIKLRKWVVLVYLYGLTNAVLILTSDFIIEGTYSYSWGFYPKAGKSHPIFLAIFVVIISICLTLLLLEVLKERNNSLRRMQIKYVFLSIFVFNFASIDFLPNYGINIYPFGYIPTTLLVFIMMYSIIKHRLMDIRVAVTRAGVFGIVYAVVLGIPFWVGLKTSLWQYSTIIMAVLASVGPFIFMVLKRHAENIILREERKYQKALHELSRSVARIKSVEQLSDILVHEIVQSVGVSFAATYFFEEDKQQFVLKSHHQNHESSKKYNIPQFFNRDHRLISYFENSQDPIIIEEVKSRFNHSFDFDAGLTVPFFVKNSLTAFLLVGDKARHQIFTQDDVIAFDMLSRWTSLAIENCYFWQEVQLKERQTRLQEMDTYAYSLAHEIENPIQSVYGLSDILKTEVDELLQELGADGEKRKDIANTLERITIDSKRVLDITEAISEFGKPSSGKLMPLRIEDVIDSFSYLMVPAFKKETVQFSREIQEGLGFIKGAKQELIQVLVILANNSLHALLGTQQKKLHLKAWQEEDKIRVSLTDNGYGIKKELLSIIFAPFVTTKASTEGKGMGLRNAQEFIKRQNGKIWAASEGQGKGATFILELPVAKDVTEEDLKQQDEGKSVIF